MPSLIDTKPVDAAALNSIFNHATNLERFELTGTVACSFQGMGTRTRSTFIKALTELNLDYISLPEFLDTNENPRDLAGYLDQYYDLYVIRYNDHSKLHAFAQHSQKPVINAMSDLEHPCEALADAYWFHTTVKPLGSSKVVLWGPMTNVLRSWHNVASTMESLVYHITSISELPSEVDLVVTDGWPADSKENERIGLTLQHLKDIGRPVLLPTPPFTVGKELLIDPVEYDNFSGYDQKSYLLNVQKGIISWALSQQC